MTALLAIDTSSSVCSVALQRERHISTRQTEGSRQHAQLLLPMIAELLDESSISMNSLDAIAVVSGPGSFTGLRIGIGVAQGLALAAGKPVVLISSLAALAATAGSGGAEGLFLVNLKARGGEFYFGAYRACGVDVDPVSSECILSGHSPDRTLLSALRERDSAETVFGIGDGWQSASSLLETLQSANVGIGKVIDLQAFSACDSLDKLDIRAVLRLARRNFSAGDTVAPELALPNYLKEQMDYALADTPASTPQSDSRE